MSEENDESQTPIPAVLISIVAVDGDTVKDATRLRLEIEGEVELIKAFAELNVTYLHAVFGDQFTLVDAEGKALVPSQPRLIDPLAEDGPVA